MTLLDIAKYIINTYPNSCIAYNYGEKINGIEEYGEEFLLEECMSFFNHEKINMCGCGIPENTYEVIRKLLTIRKEWQDNKLEYKYIEKRYANDLHLNMNNEDNYGMWQFMMYMLNEVGILEHGSGIGGSWLTKEGEMYLYVLNQWSKENRERGD